MFIPKKDKRYSINPAITISANPANLKNIFQMFLFPLFSKVFCIVSIFGIFFSLSTSTKSANAQTTSNSNSATAATATALSIAQNSAGADELRQKIEQQAKNIDSLNKEIQSYAALKDKTTKEARTLQGVISELNRNGKVLDLDTRRTSSQIEKANLEITQIGKTIRSSEEKIEDFRAVLTHNILAIQQSENTGFIQAILARENLSDTLGEINNRMNFGESVSQQVAGLRKERHYLQDAKHDQELKKTELGNFQTELSDKKKVVEYNKSEQSKTLAVTKNQEKTYQQLLAEKVALKASFEKELFAYESALKYTLDPASIPRDGSTVLSWPLDSVRITQNFGKTVAAKRLYVSGSHNGMDFGASIGTKVKAALSGTVIGAGDTDTACRGASFGKWVMIRHSNGLATMYAHLSVISTSEGDTVSTGQTIGYSGNTGYSTGPHLHFGVYVSNAVEVQNRPSVSCNGKVYRMPIAPIEAYLDPALYLPSR